ncbi:MAG: cell division protein ZapA [Paludibacteraceae bacterium]|nr:cell division protein ZapA [Paludibacteraceae bacterium]
MNDPFNITVPILGNRLKLTIERSDEVIVREAAKRLALRFTEYQGKYPSAAHNTQSMLLLTALEFAIDSLKAQNDLNGTAAEISDLLNGALGQDSISEFDAD